MRTPESINSLHLEGTCVSVGIDKWDTLMEGATVANKRVIDRHVKEYLPDLYEGLCLNIGYNPYRYYKTETHLILVHSAIEYFLAFD